MKQIDPIEIHARESLVDGEVEQLVDDFELLRADFCAMVVLGGGEHFAHRFEVDQVLIDEHVELSVEL